MQVDDILAIIQEFFNALKTVFQKIKEVFSALTGEEATTVVDQL